MKRSLQTVGLVLALSFYQLGSSNADVVYSFAFTNLSLDAGGSLPNFNVSITEPNFITTSGMSLLTNPVSTPLYTVNNFGADIFGDFAFSESGGFITDSGVSFSDTTFVFVPSPLLSTYITSSGTFNGGVGGNSSGGVFHGTGILTVTDTAAVPGPVVGAGLPGLIFAAGGFLAWRSRRRNLR